MAQITPRSAKLPPPPLGSAPDKDWKDWLARFYQVNSQAMDRALLGVSLLEGQVGEDLIDRITALEDRVKDTYVFTVGGSLTIGNDKTFHLRTSGPGTFVSAWAEVKTAPTGASIVLQVRKAGSNIWSNAQRLTIPAGQFTGNVSAFTIPSVLADEQLILDIIQVGSTVAGSNLSVFLRVQ